MNIEFKGLDETLSISDYAIREVTESYHSGIEGSGNNHNSSFFSHPLS